MRRALVGVVLVVLAVGLAAQAAFADDQKVTGTFTLAGPGFGSGTPTCSGVDLDSGYDDISQGVQVRVRNEDSKTIGVSSLGAGRHQGINCVFKFTVKGVPGDAKFYSVEVGRRGEITYTNKQMNRKHWKVALSLGF